MTDNRIGYYIPHSGKRGMKKSRDRKGDVPSQKDQDAVPQTCGNGESRASLEEARREQFKGLDAAIYKLSTLGLAFTLAYAKDIGSNEAVQNPELLVVSWSAYFIAIVLPLINYRLSVRAIDATLDDEADRDSKGLLVRRVNIASLVSLSIALVSTIIYAISRVY